LEGRLASGGRCAALRVGLVAFMAIKVLAAGSFSRQDSRTPVRIGVIAMVCNMVLNLLLIVPLAHVGLALATSLAAFVNAGLLWRALRERGLASVGRDWYAFLARVAGGLVAMVAVLWLMAEPDAVWVARGELQRIAWLLATCATGGLAYLAGLWLCG